MELSKTALDLAWAAGFFDGEGSTYINRRGGATTGGTVRVSIGHVDRRPLDRFLEAVGLGSVTGPYDHNTKRNPKHRPHYSYQVYGQNARLVLSALWPYLSGPKKEQAATVLHQLNDDGARTGRMSSGAAKE